MRYQSKVLSWLFISAFLSMQTVGTTAKAADANASAAAPDSTQPTTKPTVFVGGPIPPFGGVIIKGDPVTALEAGKVYIFEFWATWCIPCRAAIPHMNELHKKYKDQGVVIIGQNVWEPDAENAKAFVEKQGDDMSYRVALDNQANEPEDSKGVMSRTWMHAAGLNSIPSTWLVKDGKILWIGHPLDLTEKMIEEAKAGTFNILAAQMAVASKSERSKRLAATQTKYWDAMHDHDFATVEVAIKEMEEFYPDRPTATLGLRVRALVVAKRYDEALKLAKTIVDPASDPKKQFGAGLQSIQELIVTNPKDPAFLAEVSKMLDDVKIPETDNPNGAKAMILKLRAWITCLQGDSATSVKMQEQVLELLPPDAILRPLEVMALSTYKTGHPPALIPKHSRDKKSATRPSTQPATKPVGT